MCFGEHFQVIAFKQAGLAFIMNFFEFHARKDSLKNYIVICSINEFFNHLTAAQLSETDSLFALNSLLIVEGGDRIYLFVLVRRRYALKE